MPSWVYILRCSDGSYYTGCTTNIEQRYGEHQAGETPGYTATRLPVEMVWADEFQTIHDAIDFERQIKRWSRAKKEALIAGRFNDLPGLSGSAYVRSRR
jgi:predicted GIY-YIG superfamily endonuclease